MAYSSPLGIIPIMTPYLLLIILVLGNFAQAQVWQAENYWDEGFEKQYSNWVASEAVHKKIFVDKSSPYFGIHADCADVTYALRAIFSYENRLPFTVKNPLRRPRAKNLASLKFWDETLKVWNKYEEGIPRLVAFANFLSRTLGSESLTHNDSYPLSPENLQAGDFFSYKIRHKGSFLRHVYNIKSISPTGFFNLIYSNQQRAKDGRPMGELENYALKHRPLRMNWGFKRFKNNILQELSFSQYPIEAQYDPIQYKKAKELNESQFFKWVTRLVQTNKETPDQTLERNLKLICKLTQDRIEDVWGGVQYRNKIRNRCMNYTEYDEYSTPSRDRTLLDAFHNFKEDWFFIKENHLSEISEKNENLSEFILEYQSWDEDDMKRVQNFCPIDYKKSGVLLHLGFVYQSLLKGSLSSHPNDNIERRWGFIKDKPTNCKKWY